jgi:membrane carboxypeptidase/penicillin-binding protein PbpC
VNALLPDRCQTLADCPASSGRRAVGCPFPDDPFDRNSQHPNGARLELAADPHGGIDPLALKSGAAPLTVLVNGVPLGSASAKRTVFFTPDGPGFVRLTVMDAKGAADSVMVRLQ